MSTASRACPIAHICPQYFPCCNFFSLGHRGGAMASCTQPSLASSLKAVHVELATEVNAQWWESFVESHPESRFCQLWGYRRALQLAYGLNCIYLNIWAEGEKAGVFPSVVSCRGVRHLLSQPFNEYGGGLSNLPACCNPALAEAIFRWAQDHGHSFVRIRGSVGSEAIAGSPFCDRQELQSFGTLHLKPASQLWKQVVTHRARGSVKRAWDAGLISEVRRGSHAVDDNFYDLYLASMKRLGVPQHSKRFFLALSAGLGERLVASWVWHEGQLVAVLLGGISGCRVHTIIIASDARYWSLHPNDLANWQLLEWAANQGLTWFDFGSASSADQLRFKSKWGAELRPYSHYVLRSPDRAGTGKFAATKPVHDIYRQLWQRVLPLSVEKILGPMIRRHLY